MKRLISRYSLALISLFAPILSTQAAIVLLLTEVGDDVVLSSTGSVSNPLFNRGIGPNINELTGGVSAMLNPDSVVLISGSREGNHDIYTNALVGPDTIGPGTVTVPATTTTGPLFGFDLSTNPNNLYVDYDELFDETLGKGTGAVWENQTLDSLGVTVGTYVWKLDGRFGGDTITLTVAVPEPGVFTLLAGLGACLFVLYRRRKQ